MNAKFLVLLVFIVVDPWIYVRARPSTPGLRIIGGDVANVGQFRFAAAIYVQTNTTKFFCGGALLNNDWVITSGHCVKDAILFTIQIGSNTLMTEDPARLILSSSEYVLHPEFNPDTIENDIGLIRLRMSIKYNDYIQPINLPPVSLLNDTTVTALGWGQTSDYDPELSNELRYIQASVLSNAECKIYYGDQITNNMVCIIGNYNEGTCTGDTGGPLVEYVHRFYWIVGVASFISGNGCESTEPSGFTKTYPYTEWIQSVIY